MSARLITMSRAQAEAYEPTEREVCISIGDPRQAFAELSKRFLDVLSLRFSLIGAEELTEAGARAIAEFATAHQELDTIVVHCREGRMRSRAVARAIGYALGLRCDSPSSPMYDADRNLYLRVRRAFDAVTLREDRASGVTLPDLEDGSASRNVLGQGVL